MSLMIAGLCALDGTQRKNNHTAFGGDFQGYTRKSAQKKQFFTGSRHSWSLERFKDRCGIRWSLQGYGSEWRNLVKAKMATSLGPHTVI